MFSTEEVRSDGRGQTHVKRCVKKDEKNVKLNLALGFTQAGIVFYKPHMFALGVVRTGQKVFSGIGTFSGDAFDERSTAEGTRTELAIFSHTLVVDRLRKWSRFIVSSISGKWYGTPRS